MNWTGGGLQRHTGNNNRSIIKQQRAHFARVRSLRRAPDSRTIVEYSEREHQAGEIQPTRGRQSQHAKEPSALRSNHDRSDDIPRSTTPSRLHVGRDTVSAKLLPRQHVRRCNAPLHTDSTSNIDIHRRRLLDHRDWLGLEHRGYLRRLRQERHQREDRGHDRKRQRILPREKVVPLQAVQSPVRTQDIVFRVGTAALQTSSRPGPDRPGGSSNQHANGESDSGVAANYDAFGHNDLKPTRSDDASPEDDSSIMSPKAYPHGMPSMFDQFITMPKIEHNANEVLEYQPSRMGSPLAEVDPRQQDSGNDDQDHAEYAEQIHTLCHSLYAEPASHDALGFPVGLTSMLGSSLFSPRKEDWPFRSSSIPLPSLRLDSHLGACISSAQPRGNVSVHCSDDDKEDLFAVYDDNVSINRLGDKTKTSEKLRQDEGLHVDGHPISEHVEASSVDQERQLPKSIPNSSTYPQYMQVSDLVMPVPEVQQVQEGTSPLCNQDDRPYSGASAKSSIPPDPQAQNLAHEHQACVDLKSPAQAPSTTSAERRPSRNSLWAHFVFGSSLPDDESTTAPAFRRTEGNQSADKHLESRPSAPEQDMDALSLAPIVSSSDEALTQPTWQRDHMSTAVQRDRHREKEWSSVWDTQRYKIQSSDDILAGGAATATSSLHTTTDSASAGRDTLSDTPQDSSGTVEPGDSASRLHTQTRSDVVELGSIISPVKVEKQTPRWWRGGTGCGG